MELRGRCRAKEPQSGFSADIIIPPRPRGSKRRKRQKFDTGLLPFCDAFFRRLGFNRQVTSFRQCREKEAYQ